jgi:hypothetical protein
MRVNPLRQVMGVKAPSTIDRRMNGGAGTAPPSFVRDY